MNLIATYPSLTRNESENKSPPCLLMRKKSRVVWGASDLTRHPLYWLVVDAPWSFLPQHSHVCVAGRAIASTSCRTHFLPYLCSLVLNGRLDMNDRRCYFPWTVGVAVAQAEAVEAHLLDWPMDLSQRQFPLVVRGGMVPLIRPIPMLLDSEREGI